MDNGYENKNQASWKKSIFKNFDATLMGDFHEHQSFENKLKKPIPPTAVEEYKTAGWDVDQDKLLATKKLVNMSYAGSCIQQNFSEGPDKGYLLWSITPARIEFERKIIPNDWGFAKITITRGESVEDRINNMQFSNNKRKTKVIVVVEDFEENKSKEREQQIKQYIKDKYKCESVRVEWSTLEKTETAS
jgi:hypothetical protein